MSPYRLKGSPVDWYCRLRVEVWIIPQKKGSPYWRSPKWPNSNSNSKIWKLYKKLEIVLKIYKKACFNRQFISDY